MKKSRQFNIEQAYLIQMVGFNCEEKIYELIEYVGDDHDVFTNQRYRNIYRDIKEYAQLNKVDYQGLMMHIINKGYFASIKEYMEFVLSDDVGELSYVSSQNLYILLKDNQVRRNLIVMHQAQINDLSNNGDVFKSLDTTRDTLETLTVTSKANTLKPAIKSVPELAQYLEDKKNNPKPFDGLLTRYKALDKLLGGLPGGDLVYLAARPSIGKSALAVNIANNMLLDNKKVALFSLEMSETQNMLRLISVRSGVDINVIRYGKYDSATDKLIQDAMATLYNNGFYIDDSSGITLQHIKNKILMLKKEERPEIIFIDYLQLMTPPAATIREQEISKLSFGLKNMAKEFNIPFVVMSQLNRALEQRPDKRPMLSDLRESGSLEQDADKVIFLHRPEFFNIEYFEDGTTTKGMAEVIVAKNRGGDVGTVRLRFDGHKTKFANY